MERDSSKRGATRRVGHARPTRRRWVKAATAVAGATVCLATATVSYAVNEDRSPAPSADKPSPTPGADWTSRDAAAYWTADRMAAAAPADSDTLAKPEAPAPSASAPSAATRSAAPKGAAAARAARNARHFNGIPSVGVLFSVDGDTKAHHCTASVVHSPHGNLILTAGHCNPGTRAAFVPQYRSGATTQPHGVWAIEDTFAYPSRGTSGAGADLDFAFATVAPSEDGDTLEEVTGGNTLSPTPGYTNDVTVIGYPNVRNDPEDRAVHCATRTSRLTGTHELRMECGGFYGGTSGSPWLSDFDEETGTGRVIGVIGGLNGGGPKGPDADRISYSPYFGTKILNLYARAAEK
nr:serine protease [Streptomyces tubercidicus]